MSMKLTNTLITLCFVLGLTASVGYCLEEYQDSSNYDIILNRVKRNGGGGGGSRGGDGGGGRGKGVTVGRGNGCRSRGSFGRSKSRCGSKPTNPYPQQYPFNPNYNPSAPKRLGQQSYPGQQNIYVYPGKTGKNNYPGQTVYYPKHDYGQIELAGGALGAAVGAYGRYKLGRMVGDLGMGGHYGYYNDRQVYVRCDPPPRIETDPTTNITYIPSRVIYDARCHYYDQRPPSRYPQYRNGAVSIAGCPKALTTLLTVISVLLFGNDFNRFRAKGLTQLLIT